MPKVVAHRKTIYGAPVVYGAPVIENGVCVRGKMPKTKGKGKKTQPRKSR